MKGNTTCSINDLKLLIGKSITDFSYSEDELLIFFEDNAKFCINNSTHSWGFNETTEDGKEWFFSITDCYMFGEYDPRHRDEPGYRDQEEYDRVCKMIREERRQYAEEKILGTTITNIKANKKGKLFITLSDKIELEITKRRI